MQNMTVAEWAKDRPYCGGISEWAGDRDLVTALRECDNPLFLARIIENHIGKEGWPSDRDAKRTGGKIARLVIPFVPEDERGLCEQKLDALDTWIDDEGSEKEFVWPNDWDLICTAGDKYRESGRDVEATALAVVWHSTNCFDACAQIAETLVDKNTICDILRETINFDEVRLVA